MQGLYLKGDTSTLADADGLGTLSYQWLRNGVAISGATDVTYKLLEADVGKSISLEVFYTDGHGTVETRYSATTTPVSNVNDAPTGGVTIGGVVTQGQTLTAVTTTRARALSPEPDGAGRLRPPGPAAPPRAAPLPGRP